MNIRQLETFYWAATLGSFTAAAERMNATQSTVSMRIQDLEEDFGVDLFDRSQRTARVTAKGRELVRYAQKLLNLTAEIRERVAAPNTTPGSLRLGVAEMISVTWLPKLIRLLHDCYPKIVLEIDEALTRDLEESLRAGALDLILASGRVSGYNLLTHSLGTVDFRWMASPVLDIPTNRPLSPQELQHWPVIALSPKSYHHTRIEDWFRAGNGFCNRLYTCKSFGVASSLATAGLGITLLPIELYRDQIKERVLQVIDTTPSLNTVEFTATIAVDGVPTIAERIAQLAIKASNFEKTASLAAVE